MSPVARGATPSRRIIVIMSVYNDVDHVLSALESIAAQTYSDFEVIVYDDGSTDGTTQVVKDYIVDDNRFQLIIGAENLGVVAGRDVALAEARQRGAEWIAICDSDDIWLPEKLATQIAFLDAYEASRGDGEPPLVALGTLGNHINAEGAVRGVFDTGLRTLRDYRKVRRKGRAFFLLNSSALFRLDIASQVGGYRAEFFPGEDVDLWTRMAEAGAILNVPAPLVQYRVHGDSAIDNGVIRAMFNTELIVQNAKRRREQQVELTHDQQLAALRANPRRYRWLMGRWLSYAAYRNAGALLSNGEYAAGLKSMWRSFVMAPWLPVQRLARQVLRPSVLRVLLSRD